MSRPGRRPPQQQRSRQMVERIVDAAAHVLEEVGYQHASTNRIAAAAGVSPGSVYQYFTSKEEIFAVVVERLGARFAESIVPALRRSALQDPATRTHTVIDAVLTALEAEAQLLRALIDRVPTREQQQAAGAIRDRVGEMVYQSLASTPAALRHSDLDRTTWMIVELAQHLPVRYVLDQPPIAREDFIDDLAHIILGIAYAS
ncbi:MAG: TetR/AcrR family transcriptional regulator [Solirubrobacteraceae bacterium]